jgi:hypothetical protein
MNMTRLGSLALALSLTITLFGCPTRPGTTPDGGDDTDGGADVRGTGGAAAGSGGTSGVAGSGGASGQRVSGSVVCGSVPECPLANSGQCCYSTMDQSSACQGAGATCESVPDSAKPGTYFVATTIACDSSSDCPSTQICCYTNVYVSSSTSCISAAACVDVPPPNPGGYNTYRRQTCDPSKIAPTECLSGTCQTGPTFNPELPSYLYLCL